MRLSCRKDHTLGERRQGWCSPRGKGARFLVCNPKAQHGARRCHSLCSRGDRESEELQGAAVFSAEASVSVVGRLERKRCRLHWTEACCKREFCWGSLSCLHGLLRVKGSCRLGSLLSSFFFLCTLLESYKAVCLGGRKHLPRSSNFFWWAQKTITKRKQKQSKRKSEKN